MERRLKRAVLAMLACVLVLFTLPSFADSQVRIVRLSYLDGAVQIDRGTGQGFERAILNMPITQGTKLSVGEDGQAEIEFENGSTLRLAPDTRVSFDQLSLNSEGGKISMVGIDAGTAYFDIKHKGQDDFRAVINGHDVQVKKSSHFRADVTDRQASLAVFNGELEMQGLGENARIKKNETFSFDFDDSAKYELAKGVEKNQYDWWDKERADYYNTYAYNKKNDSFYSQYDNQYGRYGWSDLSYYGSFFSVPGYGYAWRPYNAGYGWDPFASGYWVSYPGWGYTWVSGYPWGWTPYRYGGWRFLPGYGWAWLPGAGSGFGSVWYTTPRIYNPPQTYRPPAPPPNSKPGVVPVGNPQPPRNLPGWRRGEDALRGPHDDRDRNRPRTDTAGQPVVSPKAPAKSGSTDAAATTSPRVNPDVRRGHEADMGRHKIDDTPHTMPRAVDTPRAERPAPPPHVSAPSAPRSMSSPPSAPRSMGPVAPSGGAARSTGGAAHSGGSSHPPK
jgi:hypothetical protein